LNITTPKMAATHIWGNALRWMDRHLKDVLNGVDTEEPVQMQVGGDGIMSAYVAFESWPPPATRLQHKAFVLGPRGGSDFGVLRPEWHAIQTEKTNGKAVAQPTDNISWYPDYIEGKAMHGMSTGFFAVEDIFKTFKPIVAELDQVDRAYGAVYKSAPLVARRQSSAAKTQICGTPLLSGVELVPTGPQFQLMAFLYDVDPKTNKGRLIAHGTRSVWAEEGAKPGQRFEMEQIHFHTCCYEVPDGHQVGLGLSMQDGLYEPPAKNITLSLSLNFAKATAKLFLPIVQ